MGLFGKSKYDSLTTDQLREQVAAKEKIESEQKERNALIGKLKGGNNNSIFGKAAAYGKKAIFEAAKNVQAKDKQKPKGDGKLRNIYGDEI